ncbi:hypothetical protein RSSM_05990 [Rhodopirellula sallentina SM41]|uniref:Uncharacterized protein n=1 Tax=Rhodopirellula sallentina SM41 TaxID=1263870 RepID=M5TTP0_9BACT|nr:hypothetical protein RSSM_05990 [Rhodopirellula sallentina SM41]
MLGKARNIKDVSIALTIEIKTQPEACVTIATQASSRRSMMQF